MNILSELVEYKKIMQLFSKWYNTANLSNKEDINIFITRDFMSQLGIFKSWLVESYGIIINSSGKGYYIAYHEDCSKFILDVIGERENINYIHIETMNFPTLASNYEDAFIWILCELNKKQL